MSEYVTLLGAEDVSRASHTMVSAAENFGRHVGYLNEALHAHRIWADEWLARFEQAVAHMGGTRG